MTGAALAGLSEIGRALRASELNARIEAERRANVNEFEPWLARPTLRPDPASRLCELVHFRRSVPTEAIAAPLSRSLVAHGFARRDGGTLHPGDWQLTAYRGVLAVRDAPDLERGPLVYVGEDSLRFAARLVELPPASRVLDVGCGSGVAGFALGRFADAILGIDVLPECVEATLRGAALNGLGPITSARRADFRSADLPPEFDGIVANLPGVPVPRGLAYAAAGDGGPDGLDRIRVFLNRCHEWCHAGGAGVLMRFQSLGDDSEPRLLPELRELAAKRGWSASVVADSRVPVEVRSALTAHHAQPLNATLSIAEILRRADAHMEALGASCYYSCTLIARTRGSGRVEFHDLGPRLDLCRRLCARADLSRIRKSLPEVRYTVVSLLGNLPEGFWELGEARHLDEVLEALWPLCEALVVEGDVHRAVLATFPALLEPDRLRDRALLAIAPLVAEAIRIAGLEGTDSP